MDNSYQKCFWTASGDLDCSSMMSAHQYNDHSYHVPLNGTKYLTHVMPQINQSLGYNTRFPKNSGHSSGNSRQCRSSTVPAVSCPITKFNIPMSAQSYWNDQNGQYEQNEQQNEQQTGGNPMSYHTDSLVLYKVKDLLVDLGNPDVYDARLGGIAIWKEHTLANKMGGIFKRVELHDEKVANINPAYIGNVYSWVKINIRSDLVRDILEVFPNAWYDRQKRWLSIRTDSLGSNLAMIALICLINRGVVNIRQVRHYDLPRKYMASVDRSSRQYNKYARAAYIRMIHKCALP